MLLIAEAANPEWTSVPLVGWSHARALGRVCDAHVVTQIRNRDAFERAGVPLSEYTAIDSEKVAKRLYAVASVLRGGAGKGWTTTTAMASLSYYYFEKLVWREFGGRILAREFDLVHRVTPLSPTTPSLLARRCARAGVAFVLGPLNGGVPWPKGFDSARRREREWLSYARSAYKLLPGYRSTRAHAAAIIAGSRDTLAQIPARYREKCVYLPENAVDPARFSPPATRPMPGEGGVPLRVVFLGRLVPYKGADMLLEAAAGLIRDGKVVVDVIGDGPEMGSLRAIVAREGIEKGVEFAGWMSHAELQGRLATAHVLGFPSVREFGGGVVLEAMAVGLVPMVLDYGGPGELVTKDTGFSLPIGPREEIIARFRSALTGLVRDPSALRAMSERCVGRVRTLFTWDAKAGQVLEIYRWVLGRRDKPDFGMPLREVPS